MRVSCLTLLIPILAGLVMAFYLAERPPEFTIVRFFNVFPLIDYSDYEGLRLRPIYDIKDMVMPPMNEFVYKTFIKLLDTWPVSRLLLWKLKADSEFDVVSHFAALNPRVPKFVPTMDPMPGLLKFSKEQASQFDLNKFVEETPHSAAKGHQWNTIDDYLNAYRSGKTTPLDVAKSVIQAIKKADNQTLPLRAFILLNETDILSQAAESTARWKANQPIGPLDGVPVAVKDEFKVKGYTHTYGSNGKFVGTEPEEEDSPAVERLRAAGAILFPKANMHEFGVLPIGYNPHWDGPRNPYNLSHITGGSSSGSAAAVAAGLVPLALGADGGGSIRIPASLCGVSGLKPTFARVPLGAALTVGVAGPIAATMKDLAIGYAIMSGPHEKDSWGQNQPPVHLAEFTKTDNLKDLRIGIYGEYFEHADPEIVAACWRAVDRLKSRGARLYNITIPYLQVMDRAHKLTITSEFSANMLEAWHRGLEHIGDDAKLPFILGRSFSSREYFAAQQVRAYFTELLDFIFMDVDILIVPTTAEPAPLINRVPDAGEVSRLMRFVTLANFLGNPALSTPVGYTSSGLPIGIQIIGRHWEEHRLLRLGVAIEESLERKRPALYFDVLKQQE